MNTSASRYRKSKTRLLSNFFWDMNKAEENTKANTGMLIDHLVQLRASVTNHFPKLRTLDIVLENEAGKTDLRTTVPAHGKQQILKLLDKLITHPDWVHDGNFNQLKGKN